ncbi:MAG: hypothetical protein FWD60_06840 [Candidatus Azobacteroides sp.]|nr:hypothetical protein [Candidatus Azobacteroides sp.]
MQSFNSKIIDAIIKHSPYKKNPVILLIKMFSMSKETAYRRIRNYTPFSIEEAVVLAKYLNLSLDEMLDLRSGNNLLLEKNLNVDGTPFDIYQGLIGSDIEVMEKLLAAKNVKIAAAINQMPFRFLPYKSLFKLDYCHYMYAAGKVSLITTGYSDIEIPPAVNELYGKSVSCFKRLSNITCVIDSTIFSNIIDKIRYYHRLKFLSDEDLRILQAELFELLDAYESLLRNGKNESGSESVFYYSFFNIESNIVFLEYDNYSLLQVWAYPRFPLVMKNDSQISDIQEQWIESKIRNSMLITKTTNIRQIEIFRNIYQQVLELGITN